MRLDPLLNTLDAFHEATWWRVRRIAGAGAAKAFATVHAARRSRARAAVPSPMDLLAGLEATPAPIDADHARQLLDALDLSGWCDERSLREKRLSKQERRALLEADAFLRLVAGLPGKAPEPTSDASAAADTPAPLVLIDARCFQEPFDRGSMRGDARKAIEAASAAAPNQLIALLTSVEQPPLDAEIAGMADEIVLNPFSVQESAVLFVQPSPAATSILPAARFLASSTCSTATFELESCDRLTSREKTDRAAGRLVDRVRSEAVRHYDVAGPPLERIRADLPPTGRSRSRPRVALLSPFPPLRSAAAEYSAFTARALSERVDVEVFTTGPADGGSRLPVHRLSTAPYVGGQFEAVATVVENSHLDGPVLDLLTECGGACIGHDERLVEAYVHDRGPEAAATLLSTPHFSVGRARLADLPRGGDRPAPRGYELVARCASPLIVHGHALADRIEQETGIRPAVVPYAPNKISHPDVIDHATRAAARAALQLGEDRLQVVTFSGDLDSDAETAVRALAWLRSWDVPADLHLVGDARSDPSSLQALARELGVQRNVVVHGPISGEIVLLLLEAADVAVQLRAKSLTLSPGLVACITSGTPTVASTGLVDDCDLPSYVSRVDWVTSALLVAEAVDGLRHLRNEQGVEIEAERREYLRDRSPDKYAGALLQALELDAR